MKSILKAVGLKKYYGVGDAQVRALDGVDLEIEQGKFTAIIGTSGSGKSTLLNMLGGLMPPRKEAFRSAARNLQRWTGNRRLFFAGNRLDLSFKTII